MATPGKASANRDVGQGRDHTNNEDINQFIKDLETVQEHLSGASNLLSELNELERSKTYIPPWILSMKLLNTEMIFQYSTDILPSLEADLMKFEHMFPGHGYSSYNRVITEQWQKIGRLWRLMRKVKEEYLEKSIKHWTQSARECHNQIRWAEAIWDAWHDCCNGLVENEGNSKVIRELKQYEDEIECAKDDLERFRNLKEPCPESVERVLAKRGVPVFE